MSKINAKKIKLIKERCSGVRHYVDNKYNRTSIKLLNAICDDIDLMLKIIEDLREGVHFCEDADSFCLGVAEDLGTNCSPNKSIDEE